MTEYVVDKHPRPKEGESVQMICTNHGIHDRVRLSKPLGLAFWQPGGPETFGKAVKRPVEWRDGVPHPEPDAIYEYEGEPLAKVLGRRGEHLESRGTEHWVHEGHESYAFRCSQCIQYYPRKAAELAQIIKGIIQNALALIEAGTVTIGTGFYEVDISKLPRAPMPR